jgi:hypothetical protein
LCWSVDRCATTLTTFFVFTNGARFFTSLVHFAWFSTGYSIKGHQLSVKQIRIFRFHLHVDVFCENREGLGQSSKVFLIFEDILSIQMNLISLLSEFDISITLVSCPQLFQRSDIIIEVLPDVLYILSKIVSKSGYLFGETLNNTLFIQLIL